jgi:hypothetical protein
MEQILGTVYEILSHPLMLSLEIMLGIVAFVWIVKRLNITETEAEFGEQIFKLLPLLAISSTILLDYSEYLNINPYLSYLGIESVGKILQILMALALIMNISAGLWVSKSMKDGKLDKDEKKIIYILVAMLVLIQMVILFFGYLAHIRPHSERNAAETDIAYIRFLILVIVLFFNTLISIFAIMLTYLKPKILALFNGTASVTPIPVPTSTPSPIPTPMPPLIIMSHGGAIRHSSYPF